MTEFTKEYMHKVRVSSYLIEPPAGIVVGECLDEIERLQARVQELEAELKKNVEFYFDGEKNE